MNWKEISEKYPFAWQHFFDSGKLYDAKGNLEYFLEIQEDGSLVERETSGGAIGFENRRLFDFFDKEGILITVHYDWTNFSRKTFKFFIDNLKKQQHEEIATLYSNRKDAESAAFRYAFGELNWKLGRIGHFQRPFRLGRQKEHIIFDDVGKLVTSFDETNKGLQEAREFLEFLNDK